MQRFRMILSAGLVTLALTGWALAQEQKPDTGYGQAKTGTDQTSDHHHQHQGAKAKMSGVSDQDFVKKAAEGGKAEVELGQLASQKASNDQVKQFAQKMVNDHGKANQELQSVAAKENITLPDQLDPKDQADKDRLSKLSGAEFDRAYMRLMLKDHRKDVAEFRHMSQKAQDPDIKAFASQTLPTLQEHLKLAQQTASQVGVTTGKMHNKRPATSSMR